MVRGVSIQPSMPAQTRKVRIDRDLLRNHSREAILRISLPEGRFEDQLALTALALKTQTCI